MRIVVRGWSEFGWRGFLAKDSAKGGKGHVSGKGGGRISSTVSELSQVVVEVGRQRMMHLCCRAR